VLLLGVPAVIVLFFVWSFVCQAVADHYGRPVAAEKAGQVEQRARDARLIAVQVDRAADGRNEPEVDRLEVPGTTLVTLLRPSGTGDAHVVLRSTAWGGIHCIVLAVGADGDISSTVRHCA
jgi:hypothetical protein